MDKKQAHYLATLAARETFKRTFEKLAQESKKPLTDGTVHVTDSRPGSYTDRKEEMGHSQRNKSHEGDSLGGSRMPSNSTGLDGGLFADDEKDCDCDCDDCDCNDKKKEASASIMRIAAAYAKAAK